MASVDGRWLPYAGLCFESTVRDGFEVINVCTLGTVDTDSVDFDFEDFLTTAGNDVRTCNGFFVASFSNARECVLDNFSFCDECVPFVTV